MKRLIEWMDKYSLTCKAAGLLLGGYSESVVSRWKRGETHVPKAVVLLLAYVPDEVWNHLLSQKGGE